MKFIKYITLSLTFLTTSLVWSQNELTNVVETIKTEPIELSEIGEFPVKKIKVITTREQEITMNPEQKYQLNQRPMIESIKVEKTIMIDNDSDLSYDVTSRLSYNVKDNMIYNLESESDNLSITKKENASNKQEYILRSNNAKMIGYFDENKNFIISYSGMEKEDNTSEKSTRSSK